MSGEVINPYGVGLDVSDKSIDEMFPKIDPEFLPFGHRVVVQMRRVVTRTAGGLYLPKEVKETEAYNSNIGVLIAVGPLAFKNRATGEPWPEGIWAKVGSYVKLTGWKGERWTVDLGDSLEPIMIVCLSDGDLIGEYTGDVRKVRSHMV